MSIDKLKANCERIDDRKEERKINVNLKRKLRINENRINTYQVQGNNKPIDQKLAEVRIR